MLLHIIYLKFQMPFMYRFFIYIVFPLSQTETFLKAGLSVWSLHVLLVYSFQYFLVGVSYLFIYLAYLPFIVIG